MSRRRRPAPVRIDLVEEISAAWDSAWKQNLVTRARDEAEALRRDVATVYGQSATYYLTASEIEREMRRLADIAMGGGGFGPVRFTGLGGISLLDHCREWLCRNYALDHDGGSLTARRYRPKGEPLSPAEKTAPSRSEKRRVRYGVLHFDDGSGANLCGRKNARTRGGYVRKPTEGGEFVTCKSCLKKMEGN